MKIPSLVAILALIALLFTAVMAGGAAITPPPLRQANAPDQFDAASARARLARVLGDEAPHPIDSARQDMTRAALLAEIEALGLTPEVRETFACRPNPGNPLIDCMMVRNIVFSIGPESGPAILAATHYDSVPAAPGASDAGIGIASWLEIARVLSQEQLTRRVVFLITDGEEPALIGAHVFATQDPLMHEVEALVNLEARGTRGPALFFETNQPNTDAIAAFASAPRGMANSVMADVYRILPNNTDVTEFMRPNLDVVNIAVLDGLENYHTPQDSLASQDMRSLQHMGDAALHVTRHFARAPDAGGTTPLIYTDIAGRAFVSAPSWAGQGVLVLAALIGFAAFWRAGAPGRWRAFVAPPLALLLAGAAAYAIGFGFSALRPGEDFWFAHASAARAWCTLLGLLAVLVALWFAKARNAAQMGAAGAFWFALLGFALSFGAPGISILFALPAVPYALGALIGLAWKPAQWIGAGVGAIVAVLIWAPLLGLVEWALGYEMPFVFAIVVGVLALTWLGAIVRASGEGAWRTPVLILAGASVLAIGVAAMAPSYSASFPQPLNISFFHNADTNEARIIAGSARRALPRALAADFSEETIIPGDRAPTWAAPAEIAHAPIPHLEQLSVTNSGDERIVGAVLRMDGAYRATLRIPRAAGPLRASINGVEASFADTGGETDYVNLACQGRACEGAVIMLTLDGAAPAQDWFIIGQTPGAHASAAPMIARRPETATPIQFGDGAVTLSRMRLE